MRFNTDRNIETQLAFLTMANKSSIGSQFGKQPLSYWSVFNHQEIQRILLTIAKWPTGLCSAP